MSIETFWSEARWSLGFGEWGADYTIVKDATGGGYHIGLDAAADGDIPALVAGVVVTVMKTTAMGYCVEIDTGRETGRYFTYCHIANDALPSVGDRLEVAARVGRTARGPRGTATASADFPGTAWYGEHCHLVISDHLNAAWTIVAGRTLADFYDPAPIIRQALDTARSTPLTPSEEDTMKIITNGQGGLKFVDELGADDIADFFYVPNGPDHDPTWIDNILASYKLAGDPVDATGWQFDLARHIADARWARKRGQIVSDVIASLKPLLAEVATSITGITPETVAELIEKGLADVVVKPAPISDTDRAAIAKAVVDEQAKRLEQ